MMGRRNIGQCERLALKKAWGNACAYCEKPVDGFEIDHIVAHARGGTCDLENLCVTCPSCNRRKSATPLPKMYEGLLLSLAARKAKKIKATVEAAAQKASELKKRKEVSKPKIQKKFHDPCILIGKGWRFLGGLEELGRYVSLVDALIKHGFVEEKHGPDSYSIKTKKIPLSFWAECGIEFILDTTKKWPEPDFRCLFSVFYKEGSFRRNMGASTSTGVTGAYTKFSFDVSLEEFLSIRSLASNFLNQTMEAATVAKKLKVEITEKKYITRQNGMAVLRKLFNCGLTEESYPSDISVWPGRVKCVSQPLDCSFFEQLGLTHREVVDGLASLLLEFKHERGLTLDSLNFSLTTSAKDGSCVFAFHKSWAELKLYYWRLANSFLEQVGKAA